MPKMEKTERGFPLGKFTDRYDTKCSIQDSSLATEPCIWLGVDDPKPEIMSRDAVLLGVYTEAEVKAAHDGEIVGWMPYRIPEEVSLWTRMHLTRQMAADLIPLLQKFVETGSVDDCPWAEEALDRILGDEA